MRSFETIVVLFPVNKLPFRKFYFVLQKEKKRENTRLFFKNNPWILIYWIFSRFFFFFHLNIPPNKNRTR